MTTHTRTHTRWGWLLQCQYPRLYVCPLQFSWIQLDLDFQTQGLKKIYNNQQKITYNCHLQTIMPIISLWWLVLHHTLMTTA